MPLPDSYTDYPRRHAGNDVPFYGYEPVPGRKRVELESGAKVLMVPIVPCAFFPLAPPKDGPAHPDGMKTPYPDLRHFTTRDYGNRVGVYRLLREFAAAGVKATFPVDVVTAERCAPLLDELRRAGHEIAGHGVSGGHLHHAGLTEDEERELISAARKALPEAVSWLSPARKESFATLPLLAEQGFEICLDWEMDQRPAPLSTERGGLMALPHYGELSDNLLMVARSQSEEDWADQLIAAAKDTVARYEHEGAAAIGFTLTPYVSGQPFRIKALRRMLREIAGLEGAAFAAAASACEMFEAAG